MIREHFRKICQKMDNNVADINQKKAEHDQGTFQKNMPKNG